MAGPGSMAAGPFAIFTIEEIANRCAGTFARKLNDRRCGA
jgi:hypothetical protein